MTHEELVAALQSAWRLRMNNDFEAARATLQPVLALEHPPATALLLLADCRHFAGDFDRDSVEGFLRRAMELAPDSPEPKLELAHFIHTWWDDRSVEARQLLEEARATISRADLSATLLEAHLLTDVEEKYEEALRVIDEGVARHPQSKLLQQERYYLQVGLDARKRATEPESG